MAGASPPKSAPSAGSLLIRTSQAAVALLLLEREDCATIELRRSRPRVVVIGYGNLWAHPCRQPAEHGNGNCGEQPILDGVDIEPPDSGGVEPRGPASMAACRPRISVKAGIVSDSARRPNADRSRRQRGCPGCTGLNDNITGCTTSTRSTRPAVDALRTESRHPGELGRCPAPAANRPERRDLDDHGLHSHAAPSSPRPARVFVDCGDFPRLPLRSRPPILSSRDEDPASLVRP